MKIIIMVEGATEKAFVPVLRDFLSLRLQNRMPQLRTFTCNGRLPKEERLRRDVEKLLIDYDAVIALTDVYTGNRDFQDAADAKQKMRGWVGDNPDFYPHCAPYEFEAWLLPFWSTIQELAGRRDRAVPNGSPEQINHGNPPSKRIREIFELGGKRSYSKTRDASRILKNKDLLEATRVCPELKAFLNTILSLCEGELIP